MTPLDQWGGGDASPPALSRVEAEVTRLRGLQQVGLHDDVLPDALTLLANLPQNRDVLLIVATSQRCLGQIDAAMHTLDQLERLYPRFSRLHQERGMGFVARRDARARSRAFWSRSTSTPPCRPVGPCWKVSTA